MLNSRPNTELRIFSCTKKSITETITNAFKQIGAVLQKVLHDTRGNHYEQSVLSICSKIILIKIKSVTSGRIKHQLKRRRINSDN